MKRRVFAVASMSMLLVSMLVPGSAGAAGPQRFQQGHLRRAQPGLTAVLAEMKGNRRVEVAVQLRGQPVSTYEGIALATGSTLSAGRKQDIRHTLGTRQRVTALRLRSLGATIQFTYTDVFNGFRIRVKAKQLDTIARLANVQAVLTVPRHTRDNVNTVPYLGADKTWGQTGKTGKGVKIAIIDTGINYYHLDFGGKGNTAWKADDSTVREPGTFPTSKVVGGYDLVGDSYDADTQPVPHPDPDPLDCKAKTADQHGTHVAGTAAGTGVTGAGKTYTGPYDAHTLAVQDIDALAPGDVWAVGSYDESHHYATMAEHWDGSTWSFVSTPAPIPTSASDPAWPPRPSCSPIASSAARARRTSSRMPSSVPSRAALTSSACPWDRPSGMPGPWTRWPPTMPHWRAWSSLRRPAMKAHPPTSPAAPRPRPALSR